MHNVQHLLNISCIFFQAKNKALKISIWGITSQKKPLEKHFYICLKYMLISFYEV